jgi:hypothetical protein
MLLEVVDVQQVLCYFHYFKRHYPENSARSNYFLAACYHLNKHIDPEEIITDCPHGGLIGIGDSWLERIFGNFKVFRLHAVLHDASGYMKRKYNVGPGYVYSIINFPRNSCFLGHVTGLSLCAYIKLFRSHLYDNLSL